MSQRPATNHDWQLQHYGAVGEDYGKKHFTQANSEFTIWILDQIAAVHPTADSIAEIGAGTCIFASLLGKKLAVEQPVVCYEPVAALLEQVYEHANVHAVCAGAIEFAQDVRADRFALIFTKDTAHHFTRETLDAIHQGICAKLTEGGRYVMVVRVPPRPDTVPVGSIAAAKWSELYTSLDVLLRSMRSITDWKEVKVTRWTKRVDTPVGDWLEGIRRRDTWSVFSALTTEETEETLAELQKRFDGADVFGFPHEYDVAVFEKS